VHPIVIIMVTKSLIGVLLIATTACATESQTGTAVGAGGGALIGGLAGGGTGAIVGAALGGLLGYGVGRTQEIENERRVQASLDAGQPMSWSNPSGFAYTTQPGPVFYQGPTPCRDFTMYSNRQGTPVQMAGTACREPDGRWRVVATR
jgi:surface antigen